jgi:Zn-dependent protease
MTVRLFGHDVEITLGFWLSAVLLGYIGGVQHPVEILVWVVAVLISILVHEFGHALAFRLYGVRSNIRLHFMGGLTIPNVVLPLSRGANAFISFAGPLAGFMLGGITLLIGVYGGITHPGFAIHMGDGRLSVLEASLFINFVWGIVNLMPVLPYDGGHILEAALGPKRYRLTLGISALVGTALAIFFAVQLKALFATYLFGTAALQSFMRLREVSEAIRESSAALKSREPSGTQPDPIHPHVERALREARRALEDERWADATRRASDVIDGKIEGAGRPASRSVADALTILAWAELAQDNVDKASDIVTRLARQTTADPALVGSVALARGDVHHARAVLEEARAKGDERKEVFAPLIRVLLQQGEPARAASIALESFDNISTEDARTLAGLCNDAGAFAWAARLFEAAFRRDHHAEDAFEAARSFARGGDPSRALELLRSAVSAGFTDATRAWDDDALSKLEIDGILPRSS